MFEHVFCHCTFLLTTSSCNSGLCLLVLAGIVWKIGWKIVWKRRVNMCRCRQMQAACCSIIGGMFSELSSQPQVLQRCSSYVQPILARVSECLDSAPRQRAGAAAGAAAGRSGSLVGGGGPAAGGGNGGGAAKPALIALLRQLTVDTPPALHASLAEADPLPPGMP